MRDNEDGVIMALEEEYGYILRKPMADFFAKKDCRLKVVTTILGNDGYGIALPRQSARLGEFNSVMRRMREGGYIEDIKDKWWKAEPCPYPQYADGHVVRGLPLWGLLTLAAASVHLIYKGC